MSIRIQGPAQLGWIALALTIAACRKPTPDEVVYTGRSAGAVDPGAVDPGVNIPVATDMDSGSPGSTPIGLPETDASVEASLPEPDEPFSKRALLAAVATCAMDRYTEFLPLAVALRDKSQAYAVSHSTTDGTAARNAWVAAMTSWEQAELFLFGPAGPAAPTGVPGGKGVRDQIYAWPLVSTCAVDEQIVSRAFESSAFATSRVNGRGLAAFEYLAFYSGGNGCSQFSAINASGTWSALAADEITSRRADYGARVAADVATFAETLVREWDPAGGNFRRQVTEPGSGTYATDQDALNAVSDAMFYVEREVKDLKLGLPIGVYEGCLKTSCPELVESRFSHLSTANLRSNLAGFRRLFQGCKPGFQGLGFDDWLKEVGATDVADRMVAALDGADAALRALDFPLDQAMVSEPARVLATHAAVKKLTDILKTEFVTVLNLELPKVSEGDND